MSVIGQRVFVAGGNQLYMSLANEEYVRPLGIGSNWTKLRIGLLLAQTPNGVSNFTTAKFFVGLCSGTASPYGAASTTNCIGFNIAASTEAAGTWTYVANAGNPYFNVGGGTSNFFKRVAVTVTSGAASQIGFVATNTGTLQRKSPVYIDIVKGSPNWTGYGYQISAANMALDWTFANLLEGMESIQGAAGTTPVIGSLVFSGGSAAAVAFTEVAGAIDTLDLLWNNATFTNEIYGIAVYRGS